eukprot:NODE_282_length_10822_cov_1.088035.p4 type:complete len:422 gc:universal NODE_282_length_10822_cov_1.088035:9367-10632(+)
MNFMEFIEKGDYSSAKTILQFNNEKERSFIRELWIAFCHFELGNYEEAYQIYKEISYLDSSKYNQYILKENLKLYALICQFWLHNYSQIRLEIEELPKSGLLNRFKLQFYERIGEDVLVEKYHNSLQETPLDNLTLASIQYKRNHYHESLKIFKKMHADDPNMDILHLYGAMCNYKLEFYDRCISLTDSYLSKNQESFIASNLKACSFYRLYRIKDAQIEIKPLLNVYPNGFNKVLAHNMALFTNDDQCLKIWNECIQTIPEAACNIVLHHLKNGEIKHAKEVADKIHPVYIEESVVKAVCYAEYGQMFKDEKLIQSAINMFEGIGLSETEQNTILGRQCMSSALFLQKSYEEAEVYLDSISNYMVNNDVFHFNIGQIKMRSLKFEEAANHFNQIKNLEIKDSWLYIFCLCKSRNLVSFSY